MFKTGVDVETMQKLIPERDVRFNYYDGHYTSLWYLIAKGALGPSEQRPEIVVWGFRPAYAMLPAFRQNRPNSTDLFAFEDRAYDRLTSDFDASPLIDARSFLDSWSSIYSHRSEVHDKISNATETVALEALDAASQNVDSLRDRLLNGQSTIADEIVRAATGGEVQLTEEQVVDGVGDFVEGPVRDFADGFIPITADAFTDRDLAQIVVLWKPVNVANGEPIPEEDQFIADAIAYFVANGIPYVDFYHDDRIVPAMYGKGDHYNAEGRARVTEILTEAIRQILEF
jgi:hypothetical protein